MESAKKKRCIDPAAFRLNKNLLTDFAHSLSCMCSFPKRNIHLTPLEITNCNAADNSNRSFSKAYCAVTSLKKGFMFGDIFRRGLDIAVDFLAGTLPENAQENYLLDKLLDFISEEETIKVDLDSLSETELTTFMANHLFGKLSASPCYVIDGHCAGKRKNQYSCVCGKMDCKLTGVFGDTSIGNGEVWHGNVDIITANDLAIEAPVKKPESPGRKSPVEVKLKDGSLTRNAQILAETIVFSFLQKQRHPEREHFLTPCIALGSSKMVFMFYDSEHDVLLESSKIKLFIKESGLKKFCLDAVVASWMAVNYMFLCTGLTEKMFEFKSKFFEKAKAKLDIYKNNLSLGNVRLCSNSQDDSGPIQWEEDPKMLEKHQKICKLYQAIASTSSSSS